MNLSRTLTILVLAASTLLAAGALARLAFQREEAIRSLNGPPPPPASR